MAVLLHVLGLCQLGAGGPDEHQVARAAAEVLGVSPAAELREVQAAFRRGSFLLHPEAGTASSDRAAYETLCEGALALSSLRRQQGSNNDPGACAAPAKQPSLAVTELLLAAQRGDTATARAAMQAPCFTPSTVEARDVFGLTPLHWAAREGHAHLAGVLIAHGANLESRTSTAAYGGGPMRSAGAYHTPLMMAASHGHAHAADVLLTNGALVGSTAADGTTDAMLLACLGAHKTVVGVLLDHVVVAVPSDCSLPPKAKGDLGMHATLRQMHQQDASAEEHTATALDASAHVRGHGEHNVQRQGWDLPAFGRFLALRPHQSASSGSPQLLFNSLDMDRSGVLDALEFKALPRYLIDDEL